MPSTLDELELMGRTWFLSKRRCTYVGALENTRETPGRANFHADQAAFFGLTGQGGGGANMVLGESSKGKSARFWRSGSESLWLRNFSGGQGRWQQVIYIVSHHSRSNTSKKAEAGGGMESPTTTTPAC